MTTVEPLVRVYQPRGTARRIFSMRDGEIVVSGPAGTGKSRACLEKVFHALMKYPGARALIVRKTHTSLTSTALVTFREHVAREAIENGDVEWYSGSAEEPPGYRFKNGSRINVGGMDKSDKIMSSEYDLIYAQEATELREEDWDKLSSRLRNGLMPYQQLLADCNPSHPKHWLKLRSDRGDTVMLHARHEENPRYFNADGTMTEAGVQYIQGRLDKLTGVRKLRLRDGKWVAAEGAIYGEEWDESVHLVDPFPIPEDWPRYWVVDFGFRHPFVCQMWAEDDDGDLFMYREFFMTQRLVEDHARQIMRTVTKLTGKEGEPDYEDPLGDLDRGLREWAEPEPTAIFCDHDAEGRGTFERHTGLRTEAATKKVTEGIQAVQARLRPQDGPPRIFLFRDALVERDQSLVDKLHPTCTAEEFPGYVWDTTEGVNKKERPVKEQDDGMDCVRYIVAARDLERSTPNVRWL